MPSVTFGYGTSIPDEIVDGQIKIKTSNGDMYFDIDQTRIQIKDSTKLPLTGGTVTGAINMSSNKIINLASPSASNDAANKSYVDSKIINYSAGTAISISGSTISHANLTTAGTVGNDSAVTLSPGASFNVPRLVINAQGHITNHYITTVSLSSSVLTSSKIANNVTTTAGGYVLDARQGRALNTEIASNTSRINTIVANYLNKHGDTLRGNLNIDNNIKIRWGGGAIIYQSGSQHLYLAASEGESSYFMHHGVHDNTWTFDPDVSGMVGLGTSNHRYNSIYSTTNVNVSSDRNAKHNIRELNSSQYDQLFDLLKPVSFIYNQNDSNRTHLGLIAQDVEDALQQVGIDSKDFAGFCKDNKRITVKDEDGSEHEQVVDGEYTYTLRYGEFIPLLIHVVQILKNKLADIEIRIDDANDAS